MPRRQTNVYSGVDSSLLEFGDKVDDVRQSLYYCNANRGSRLARLINENVRATSYVHVAAGVEVFVNSLFGAVLDEINSVTPSLGDLRLSLVSIAKHDLFSALSEVRGLRNWKRRCEILVDLDSGSTVNLDPGKLPLDGRTIRPEHLQSLWDVLGIPGAPLPGLRHRLALSDLADARNDVAHGNELLAKVAKRKPDKDLFAQIDRIEEIGIHLHGAATYYLSNDLFRR